MKERYLEVTFRKGKPLAAYLYLSRKTGTKCQHTQSVKPGLLVDYGPDDQPIGIEITAPDQITVKQINEVLSKLNLAPVEIEELSPLIAA